MITQKLTAQKGFTLIELMISLTLGLIVIAAAVGIYLANYKTLAAQKNSSEMQSASMLGIQPLESRLRLANLGNDNIGVTDTTANGGIVLAAANAPAVTDEELYSTTATGESNTNTKSDQLTIQFTNVTPYEMFDCEGRIIKQNARSIERYFVRSGANGLVLACDAGVYDDAGALTNFGDDGVELVAGVDLFRYMLGVQKFNNQGEIVTRFYTADEYVKLSGTKPNIVLVKAGVVARGSAPSSVEGLFEFLLLNEREKLKGDVSARFVRNTFETTTLLRNARVATVQVISPIQ